MWGLLDTFLEELLQVELLHNHLDVKRMGWMWWAEVAYNPLDEKRIGQMWQAEVVHNLLAEKQVLLDSQAK